VHVAHDITARNRITQEIRRKASIDALTELPNRTAFLEHLNRALAAIKRRSSNLFAVLFIDLDHFKEVNDTFGHTVADRLLEITARRLERCARADDIVARLGGDEFAVLLNGINGISDASDAADRISAEMRNPAPIDARTVRATVSVGIALGSPRYNRAEDVLRDADAAMYVAKAGGRGRSRVYTKDLAEADRATSNIEADLCHAIDRNELRVFYQPVIRLADCSIAGFEALVRWQHPRRGLLEPRDFILKAEESDLIMALDRWVLREACRTLASWRKRFAGQDLAMSVNFSSKEFANGDVVEDLRAVLASTGIPPSTLHVEITESAIMEHSERTAALLASIRAIGVELQIDDFGVGYSSLAALGHMPVNALKIDRSFVSTMDSHNGAVLIRTVTHLAHNLGMAAIAEGIETAEQLDGLLTVGCDFGQGFLFSKPLDANAAGELLAAGKFLNVAVLT
jgi:diguanylate cyclase (GGDEF)-like protein